MTSQVPEELRERPLGALSGGWQRTALLARVWVTEPDVLLMDEPTNHLDLGRIGFLQTWLDTVARGVPVVVASHDRAFLDAVTTRTLFLRETRSQVVPLPFSQARRALAESDAAEERRFENDMKQAAQLRRQAAKLKNIGINSGSDLLVVKTKQLKERADRLEAAARPAHQERSAGAIRLANGGTPSRALVAFDDVAVTAPDGRLLFGTGKLWINKGDRIVLLGRNGSGKSQLMSLVHRAVQGRRAGRHRGADGGGGLVGPGSGPARRVPDALGRSHGALRRGRRAGAGAACGRRDRRRPPAGAGSPRSRAGRSRGSPCWCCGSTQPNLYLLDEPTNHLDIEGQEALEARAPRPRGERRCSSRTTAPSCGA